MASSPPPKSKGSSRWGSLLSGAVAGLESRLDTILAEDNEASARSRALEKTAQQEKTLSIPQPSTDSSRSSSRSRQNDRLQERLAKALANQRTAGSEAPSRSSTPLPQTASPRSSLGSRPSTDLSYSAPEKQDDSTIASTVVDDSPVAATVVDDPPVAVIVTEHVAEPAIVIEDASEPVTSGEPSTLLTSGLPINPARVSEDSQSRPSLDTESTPSIQEDPPRPNGHVSEAKSAADLEAEIAQMRQDHTEAEKQRQDEMMANLERIDALQAKLQYLAKETVAAAKEANSSAKSGSLEQKLSEKDERIALLMQEGEKLTKTEMRQLGTIKKMRAKAIEDERTTADLKKRLAKLEDSESELKQKVRRLEQVEKQNTERLKRFSTLEKDLDSRKSELTSSKATAASLRKQLAEAETKAEEAENKANDTAVQVDTKKVSALQEQLQAAELETKQANDKSNKEIKRITEEFGREREQASLREAELNDEISNLEGRVEALRARAEEATSDIGRDPQAKLLRQIETLQTQYSLAAENWRTIESSLNGRMAAIEKERDEATKRETDIRKKARDISAKSKRTEEELDKATEESQNLSLELQTSKTETTKLQSRFEAVETSLAKAKADFDRQRFAFETELNQKLEEERTRLLQQGLGIGSPVNGVLTSRTQSPTNYFRKQSTQEPFGSVQSRRSNIQRVPSHEQNAALSIDRAISRRPSTLTPTLSNSRTPMTPDFPSPGVNRQGSTFSLAQLNTSMGMMPVTPSIHTNDIDADDFDNRSSPQRTINDVISASTVHTGPSVQLVERMSSSIRRLEAEKAAHKDELARLVSQRDEARDEVVTMMREVDTKRNADGKTEKLESELAEVKKRYEACLEILGEREEQIEEMQSDIVELKKIYRDLVEKSMK